MRQEEICSILREGNHYETKVVTNEVLNPRYNNYIDLFKFEHYDQVFSHQ